MTELKTLKDFEKKFGKEKMNKCLNLCGHHFYSMGAGATGEKLNLDNDEERLIFSLLEMLDFECFNYNSNCNIGLTKEEIKDFLLLNKDKALKLKSYPSGLGLLCGVYDFLKEDLQ